MNAHSAWIICALVYSTAVCLTYAEKLYATAKGKPPIQSYADCITYELLEAQARNMSLMQIRQDCNRLFIEQMETWTRNIKEESVTRYIGSLLRGVHSGIMAYKKRKKRSIFNSGVQYRKEIREPPYDQTWGCFLRGIQRLKRSYDIRPDMNTYDIIASLHIPKEVIPTAHDGPGFFAWHRMYLKIMELAIGCPIPYWDTTLDWAMDDPVKSIVWSDKYFGNGYGFVTTGIMRGLPTPMPVVRNINADWWLISSHDVKMAMGKKDLYEFTEKSPCYEDKRTEYSWECFHKGIHYWIDGTIGPANTSSFDPIFFPIHAHIDKIFEQYRQKLRQTGIDPAENYPAKGIEHHGPDHKTKFIAFYPGIDHMTNRQCYGDELAALTIYSDGPTCPTCSNSEDLYCDQEKNQCVSKSRSNDESAHYMTAHVTDDGVRYLDAVEKDELSRIKKLITLTGPLPFGTIPSSGSRDQRTRRDAIPMN